MNQPTPTPGNGRPSGTKTGTNLHHLIGFEVDNQQFGIAIEEVREIIRMVPITRIPNAPEFIRGIISLRGTILPVVDFRARFGMADFGSTGKEPERQRIVVVEMHGREAGIVVDAVSQVVKLPESEIADAPASIRSYNTDYVKGVGKLPDGIIVLLDFSRFFSSDEVAMLARAATPEEPQA